MEIGRGADPCAMRPESAEGDERRAIERTSRISVRRRFVAVVGEGWLPAVETRRTDDPADKKAANSRLDNVPSAPVVSSGGRRVDVPMARRGGGFQSRTETSQDINITWGGVDRLLKQGHHSLSKLDSPPRQIQAGFVRLHAANNPDPSNADERRANDRQYGSSHPHVHSVRSIPVSRHGERNGLCRDLDVYGGEAGRRIC